MDIADWRQKIDEIDRKLVLLISERAQAALEIGRLKREAGFPVYEPDRERLVFENLHLSNPGPLADRDLLRVYERILDVMRQIQQQETTPEPAVSGDGLGETELDPEVND